MAIVDFAVAKSKHLLWKTRIAAFLAGKETLTKDQAVSHTACDLGKWLHGDGMKKYGTLPDMKSLEKAHIDLHSTVKKIVELKTSGKNDEAHAEAKRLESISTQIVGLLTALEGRVS